MKKELMLSLAGFLLSLAMPASQATTIWDFGTDNAGDANTDFGDLGTVPPDITCRDVTQSGATLTACGYDFNGVGVAGTPHELHFKDKNPPPNTNEHGLGLADTPDNELTRTAGGVIENFMQIDLLDIYMTWSNPMLRMQSVTQDERFDVFGSDTMGVLGTLLISASAANDVFLNVPGAFNYRYLGVAVNPSVGSSDDNVLLDAFKADPPEIPEPSTVALLGGGLLLFAPVMRRRRRQ